MLQSKYKNLKVQKKDLYKEAIGSPVEKFLNSGYIEANRTIFEPADYSDILRLIYLHRYGGLYQDLDVLTLSKIPAHLPKNFIELQPGQGPWNVSHHSCGIISMVSGCCYV